MLKKLSYGLAVAALSAGITAVVMNAQAGKSPAIPGFDHPNADVIQQPTRLKRQELFSEGHTADVVAIQQVWAAYTFYNDAADGDGMASLFTEDGVDQHLWNDMPKLVPHYGINPTPTPMGPKGAGCVLRGRKEISWYFGGSRQKEPWPWPGRSHHETPSILVKVSDDGKSAILTTPYVIASTNDKGEGRVSTGGYRVWFKKTTEGWLIAEQDTTWRPPSESAAISRAVVDLVLRELPRIRPAA